MSMFGEWAPVIAFRKSFGSISAEPLPVADEGSYVHAREEARAVCVALGLDVGNAHWQKAGVADFVRLAYAQAWRACEQRLLSASTADAIATAIENPGAIVPDPGFLAGAPGNLRWQVQAVQQAAVNGVPK